jgi:DNA-binding response OmpR family regulator
MESPRTPRILLADDESSILTLLTYPLAKDGYDVVPVRDGSEALARFSEGSFDLVVLDVMMPEVDGLEVCRRLRAISQVPIIMLTARAEEIDKVLGLELGADDYITKPFSMREFSSRVRALLRRSAITRGAEQTQTGEVLRAGDMEVDLAKRLVRIRGFDVTTTYIEFELLALMAAAPGRVFSRDALLEQVWGDADYRDPRTIDVHIRHLREKVELDPKEPQYLFTVRNVGYRFRDASG